MAFVYDERVQESSVSTGTGNLTLGGAPDATYQAFGSVLADGDTTDVSIFGAGGFESRRVTYNLAGNALVRDGVIYASSNAGAAVNFAAGTKTIVMCLPGELAQELVTGEVDYGLITGAITISDDYGSIT